MTSPCSRSGDSRTRAKLEPVWPYAFRLGRPRTDPVAVQAVLLEAIAKRAAEFDVIHCHIDWLHLPLLSRSGVPFLTTLHGRLDIAGLPEVVRRFPDAPFVSISNNQRLPLPGANWLGTVYHGLPANSLRARFEPGSYLAFLGRLTKEKGPEAAMRIARSAGMPLRIAAKVPKGERGYFKEQLEPMIDGREVQLIGEVNDQTKERISRRRCCIVVPHRLARAVRPGDDRGYGLRHACHRLSSGFGARSDRRRGHWFRRRQRRGSRARRQAPRRDSTGAKYEPASSAASPPGGWPASMSPSMKSWCAVIARHKRQ